MDKLKNIQQLKADPANPRKITQESADMLRQSMEKYGDLSGIVWNKQTGELVCGHQRMDQLKQLYGDELQLFEFKDAQYIGAIGKEQFEIRIVDWDRGTQTAANIAANSEATQGTFNNKKLLENLGNLGEAQQHLTFLGAAKIEKLKRPKSVDPRAGAATLGAHRVEFTKDNWDVLSAEIEQFKTSDQGDWTENTVAEVILEMCKRCKK